MISEVKLLIPAGHWASLRRAARLEGPGEEQGVWFFDTATQCLRQKGIVLRVRLGKKFDTTVKLRAVTGPIPDVVLQTLQETEGFKFETDCSPETCTPAASLRMRLSVQKTPAPLGLFSSTQLAMLHAVNIAVPWSDILRHGPIRANVYEEVSPDTDITRWRIGEDEIIEISQRTSRDPLLTLADLQRRLTDWGLPSSGRPGGKTAWALDRLTGTADR